MPLPGLMRGPSGFNPSTPLGTFVPEQGGYYIGTILDGGKNFALFYANKAEGQNNSLQWKTTETTTAGTTSLTNGPANLAAMVTVGIALHPAGQFCKSLMIGDFTDWYLPAKDELSVIYTNRTVISGVDAIDVDTTFYWSSSEYSATPTAWIQRFSDGVAGSGGKINSFRVRAVRRLEIP